MLHALTFSFRKVPFHLLEYSTATLHHDTDGRKLFSRSSRNSSLWVLLLETGGKAMVEPRIRLLSNSCEHLDTASSDLMQRTSRSLMGDMRISGSCAALGGL